MIATFLILSLNSAANAQTWNWKPVNIQGTGYITGLLIHPNTAIAPNTIYARTDVGGAYRYDSVNDKWIAITDAIGAPGIESIAIDPNVANTVYAALNPTGATYGDILISTDKGSTWSSTGLSSSNITMSPNALYRGTTGERLMVDPQKSGLLYFGSRTQGLWSKNGSGAWTQVGGGLPTAPADPGITFVAFDKSSGTVGGVTKTIYAGVWGSGVWQSTNGGSTWTNIGGGTGPSKGIVSPTGVLYVVYGQNEDQTGGTTGSVYKYGGGTWTNITPSGNTLDYTGISMDPTNSSVIMVQTLQEAIFRTTNGGTSWSQISVTYSNVPPYHTEPGGGYGSGVEIDPNNVSHVWHQNGYGIMRTDNITASPVNLVWHMLGFEELVINNVAAPPYAGGADLLTGAADMIGFRNTSRDVVPTAKIGTTPCGVGGAKIIDYCYTQPQYACFVGWDQCYQSVISGYTSNNGQTWTTFGSTSPGSGGAIAMSATNPQNLVWGPTSTGPPNFSPAQTVVSFNGGASWAACNGITTSWGSGYTWSDPKYIAADRVNGNKFYFFSNGSFSISTNGGSNWTTEVTTLPQWRVMTNIIVNPTTEGDVWLTFAPGDPTQPDLQAYHSTNSGASFSPVTTMDSARYLAFGRGSSSTNPYIYILGKVGGATSLGVYRSTDMGATWTLISDPTQNNFARATCMEADMRTQNVVYVGTGGRGLLYAVPSALQAQIVAGTPTIDGNVDAVWSNTPANILTKTTGTISGASDCSGTWQGLWDSTNLYVLVNVTDDVKKNDSVNVYDDDSVEVYLDADHNGGSAYDANDRQFQFRWNDASVHEGGGRSTTGVAFAQADPSSTSYRMEIKIPWSNVAYTPASNNIIGIDVHVNDDDDGGSRDGKIIWNDGTDNAWTNPSVFGSGVLYAPPVESPFNGSCGASAAAIPGTISAANYDCGGEGVGYHDTDSTNNGGQYRPSDGVDIGTTADPGLGYCVGWSQPGEWMKYTVNVSATGLYNIAFRAGGNTVAATCHLEDTNGTNLTGTVTIPNTNGGDNWATVTVNNVNLTAGSHILKFVDESVALNFHYMSFTAVTGPPPAPTGLTATPSNNQVALSWSASSGATAYDVKRSTVSGSGYATVSSPATTSYTNTGLTNGTTYYFVVDAKNASGTSGNSSQVSAIPIDPNVHTGTWCVKGVLSGTPGFSNYANTVNVASNTNYTASLWIKGTGSVALNILAGNWGSQITTVKCTASSTWTQVSVPTFSTGSNTQLTYVVQDSYTTAGTVYIDDSFMGVANGTNTLANAGYESGNTVWSFSPSPVFSIVQNP